MFTFFPSFLLCSSFNHKTEAENVHFTLNSSSSDDGDEGDTSGTSDEDKSVIDTLSSSSSGCHFSHQFLFRTRLWPTDIFFPWNLGDNLTDSGDDPNTLEMIVVREVEAGAEVSIHFQLILAFFIIFIKKVWLSSCNYVVSIHYMRWFCIL